MSHLCADCANHFVVDDVVPLIVSGTDERWAESEHRHGAVGVVEDANVNANALDSTIAMDVILLRCKSSHDRGGEGMGMSVRWRRR